MRPGLTLAVLVAAAAATGLAAGGQRTLPGCRAVPGLGSVALLRHGTLAVVDLTDCSALDVHTSTRGQVRFLPGGRTRIVPASARLAAPGDARAATVRLTGKGRTLRDTIWISDARTHRARPVFSARVVGDTRNLESPGRVSLIGWSGDARWLFFAIDPGSSASMAADGLILRVVAASGGRPHRLGVMLVYPDHVSWCAGRLVFTAGADRVATHDKRLLVASPPAWRPRRLVTAPGRTWGSLACAGGSVLAQSQRSSVNARFFATRWSLWRVGLDGSLTRLTSPPAGNADESPRSSRDGRTILFVRSRNGVGRLFALRHGRVIGPLLPLGFSLGYYGHQSWWQRMDWSLGRPL